MAALIQFASGAPGIKYALDKRHTLIGRTAKANDISLPCSFVSKHHAIIMLVESIINPGTFDIYIEDLKSKNHTYVNDEPITRVKLEDGDIVRIGRNTLKYDSSGEVPELEAVEVDLELPNLDDVQSQSQTWNFSRRLSLISSEEEE